jgi:hypothetical protein
MKKVKKVTITEGDIVDFSSYAGMYSNGARTAFRGRDGKIHRITATGDLPRKYTFDGNLVEWAEIKKITTGIKLGAFNQGIDEAGSIGKSAANAFAMDNPNRPKASTAWVKGAFKGKQVKVNALNKGREDQTSGFQARARAAQKEKEMNEAGTNSFRSAAKLTDYRLGEAYEHEYNKDAVDKEIKKDPRIKGREAKSIHAFLKGRTPKNKVTSEDTPGATDADRNPSMERDARKGRNRPQSDAERSKAAQKRDAAKGMKMDPSDIAKRAKIRAQFGEGGMDVASASPRQFNLDKVTPVTFSADDTAAKEFARIYTLGNRGDHRQGGPNATDERNSEKFWGMFDVESLRGGFAGSGESRYTNRKTGEKFVVDRSPNGKTFYGTDHHVSVEAAEVTEAVAKIACTKCDAVSTAAAWKKNNGTCPKCNKSTQGVAESKETQGMKKKYGVYSKGGSIDSQPAHKRKPIKTFDNAEEAKKYAARMRKQLSKGEKGHYKMSYTTKPITEGVLDDMDDDGFMAKRQLYDIAKAAVQLHKQIQDTDNLEPWIQAKITKANDYLETIYHYMEYKNVRAAGETADVMGPPDMDNMDAVGDAVATIEPQEAVIEDTDGATLDQWDILRMAYARKIIAPEQYEDPDDDLLAYAGEFAERLGVVDEIGSSDISIFMREFIADLRHMDIAVFGEKVGMYESDVRARKIYLKMINPLRS